MARPVVSFRGNVRSEWIDYNSHMSEGYYGVVFGDASDGLLTHLGFDETYRVETRGSFYTVETRITFESELAEDEPIRVHSTLVGSDKKRLHVWHELFDDQGERASAQETLMLHVDQAAGRVVPMGSGLAAAAQRLTEEHATLPGHDEIGRVIRPVPKRA